LLAKFAVNSSVFAICPGGGLFPPKHKAAELDPAPPTPLLVGVAKSALSVQEDPSQVSVLATEAGGGVAPPKTIPFRFDVPAPPPNPLVVFISETSVQFVTVPRLRIISVSSRSLCAS
jgi:hypothetical protein